MTQRVASLPMYDADRASVEAWWHAMADAMRTHGIEQVPAALDWPADLPSHWCDPRLLLSQTCGYPLVTRLRGRVQVVGAFRYTAPGCDGIRYRSELMVRGGDAEVRGDIEGYRGRAAAINARDSHSGCNALRGRVASLARDGGFFGAWHVSGSHRHSLAAVQCGVADIAAIDCITLAGLRRHAPALLSGLRSIGTTDAAPGLPLVTAASTTANDLQRLRHALSEACADPAWRSVRAALFIGGFDVADAEQWQVIDDIRQRADLLLSQ